jgi:hypothetical protein
VKVCLYFALEGKSSEGGKQDQIMDQLILILKEDLGCKRSMLRTQRIITEIWKSLFLCVSMNPSDFWFDSYWLLSWFFVGIVDRNPQSKNFAIAQLNAKMVIIQWIQDLAHSWDNAFM